MLRTLGGAHSWSSVPGWLVRHGELSEVSADHIELDLHIGKTLATVDAYNIAHHLRHHNSVSKMSFDRDGLLSGLYILLGLSALVEESGVLVLDLCIREGVLLENLLLILALKRATSSSWLSFSSCSRVSPL